MMFKIKKKILPEVKNENNRQYKFPNYKNEYLQSKRKLIKLHSL